MCVGGDKWSLRPAVGRFLPGQKIPNVYLACQSAGVRSVLQGSRNLEWQRNKTGREQTFFCWSFIEFRDYGLTIGHTSPVREQKPKWLKSALNLAEEMFAFNKTSVSFPRTCTQNYSTVYRRGTSHSHCLSLSLPGWGESVSAVRCESMPSDAISLRQRTSRLAVGCWVGTKSIRTRDRR